MLEFALNLEHDLVRLCKDFRVLINPVLVGALMNIAIIGALVYSVATS